MAKTTALANVWHTVKEVDLRPLQQQALSNVRLTLVGAAGSGRHTLAEAMRRDPLHPEVIADSLLNILSLDQASEALGSELVILVVDERQADIHLEQQLLQAWTDNSQPVFIFLNQFPAEPGSQVVTSWTEKPGKRLLRGSALDLEFLEKTFAKAVIEMLPQHVLALGRGYPLLRLAAAHYLINDACLSNTAYALTTGLAQIVPVFDIPLTVADMVVLTKTQAFLAYKLGLALGYSTNWQDYLNEFGGVLGGGFLWRQLARSLVGLVPLWGLLPKVAVSYAGTYVVGHTVLQWYLTGRHLSAGQMRRLYQQAFARGKNTASRLLKRRKGERKSNPALPRIKKLRLISPASSQSCPVCGKPSAMDANFCQYCGHIFVAQSSSLQSGS